MTSKSVHNGDTAASWVLRPLLYLFFFSVSLYLFYLQVFFADGYRSDITNHLEFVDSLANGDYKVMHLGFHYLALGFSKLPLMNRQYGAIGALVFAVMLTLYSVEKILLYFFKGRYWGVMLLVLSMAILYVGPVYLPWLNRALYIGVWSPNPWHNPTFLAARPFTLAAFFLFPCLFRAETIRSRFGLLIVGGLLIVVGAFIKPSFILAFIPACVLFLLARRKLQWKTAVRLCVLFAPVFLLLAVQYVWMYGSAENSKIDIGFLKVWKIYTQSVPAAILQGVAFPLAFILFHPKSLLRSDYLLLGWLLYITALVEFTFFYEEGGRMGHANFSWAYMSAMGILFLCSVIEFLQGLGRADLSLKRVKVEIAVLVSLFLLHLFSGLLCFCTILSGGRI